MKELKAAITILAEQENLGVLEAISQMQSLAAKTGAESTLEILCALKAQVIKDIL
jgi:hypothetical protein